MGENSLDGGSHRKSSSSESSDFQMVELTEVKSNGSGGSRALEDDMAQITLDQKETVRRRDEYDVNFNDAREFAAYRWRDILQATYERISSSDHMIAVKYGDWQDLVTEIQGKLTDVASNASMKRQMGKIQPLPRTLASLTRIFSQLVDPLEVKFDLLWGLIFLNLKHSYASPDRLKRTADVLDKIRKVVSLFIKIVEQLDDSNEALLAVVDFIDPITIILTDSLEYLHECSSDAKAEQAWPDLSDNINGQLGTLNGIVKHVSEMASYTKVNMDRQIKNMSQRHAMIPETEEAGTFPCSILPFSQNPKFYGREEDLNKINQYLKPKDDQSLRTYTIYGRRGVGKTEIALQFAYANEPGFDAIFWIQCETSVAIRQSFTDVAIKLNIPAADREGRHEENLLAVQKWLKLTKKRWLLIFDNAERDQILRAYWPIGSAGAILITSRKYHNFAKDMKREGNTVKPFDSKESWNLLLKLLGNDWEKADQEGRIPDTEVTAAKSLLGRLEGLPLAIRQAAIMIKNPDIGGPTIAKTFEMFKEKIGTLPERLSGSRSSSESALDALWDMTFNSLSRHARALLRVLSWLSPDSIRIDLFLPYDQKALNGSLSFCKQKTTYGDEGIRANLSTLVPTPGFEKAVAELLAKQLIKKDGRQLSIHRVVQEAVNFHDVDDLQESFDVASRLVHEQFPKQSGDRSLYEQWNICADYIHHGVHLSKKYYDEFSRKGIVKGSQYFVKLLSNCGWYLHEIGDYDVSQRVINTAMNSCDDKTSLLYAQLLSIAGSRFYDLNRLNECREVWSAALKIRRDRLAHDDPLIAAILHNLGNLETASGDLEESRDAFDRATLIWKEGGDETAFELALTYLCLGRQYMLRGALGKAEDMVRLAEGIFVRKLGKDKGIMAHVHLGYGNIHYYKKHWDLARRSYKQCYEIALAETPIHPITASAYYSMGCVEFELKHPEVARGYLDKARAIAELRSPIRDDGVIARILWKTAIVLESNTVGAYSSEATELRIRAEVAKGRLLAGGEGGTIPFQGDREDEATRDPEEDSYDALVPLFFR